MRIQRKLLVLALASAVSLAAFAAGQPPAKDGKAARLSVGDFAVMLASGGKGGKAIEVNVAVASLVKAGVPLGDAGATLSEGKLAEIMAFYGQRTTTSSPDREVSKGKAVAAAQLLAPALSRVTGATLNTNSSPLPPGAEQCTDPDVSKNHGSCVNCCKDLGGKPSSCSSLCFAINKPSADEPLP